MALFFSTSTRRFHPVKLSRPIHSEMKMQLSIMASFFAIACLCVIVNNR